jgi:hypothetical protein
MKNIENKQQNEKTKTLKTNSTTDRKTLKTNNRMKKQKH